MFNLHTYNDVYSSSSSKLLNKLLLVVHSSTNKKKFIKLQHFNSKQLFALIIKTIFKVNLTTK